MKRGAAVRGRQTGDITRPVRVRQVKGRQAAAGEHQRFFEFVPAEEVKRLQQRVNAARGNNRSVSCSSTS